MRATVTALVRRVMAKMLAASRVTRTRCGRTIWPSATIPVCCGTSQVRRMNPMTMATSAPVTRPAAVRFGRVVGSTVH